MRKHVIVFALLIISFFAWTPAYADSIAFDNATSSSGTGTSLTYASATIAGSNKIAWTSVCFFDTSGTDIVSGITLNGVAMTRLASVRPTFTNAYQAYLYYLYGPTTGNVVISLTTSETLYSTTATYTGTAQSGTPDSATNSYANKQNGTASTTVSTANSWGLSTVCDGQTGTPTRGTNLNATRGPGVFEAPIADSNGAVAAGAYDMTWVNSGAANTADWSVIGAAFAPFVATPDPEQIIFFE